MVTVAGSPGSTLIGTSAIMPPDVARIMDRPASFPVITPLALTDATAEFELLHSTLDAAEVPPDDLMLAVACTELPDES